MKTKEEINFKDKISTVEKSGKRKWMYVFQPKGKLYNLRTYFTWFYRNQASYEFRK